MLSANWGYSMFSPILNSETGGYSILLNSLWISSDFQGVKKRLIYQIS